MPTRLRPLHRTSHFTPVFPVTHSILSASALLSDVLPHYDIGRPVACRLLPLGVNDSYRVTTDAGQHYILRVYRAHWRSRAEVLYEMDALLHLDHQRVHVSTPLRQSDGTYVHTLRAPEGSRQVVLFTYAPGGLLDQESPTHSYHHGQALAAIHQATDSLMAHYERAPLNLAYTIDQSLEAMQPLFAQRLDEWAYLQDVAMRVRAQAERLPSTLDWGFCHGDPHVENAYIDAAQNVTFFDFDCCAPGWRAYDLAGVRWFIKHCDLDPDGTLWQAFLDGYRSVRLLDDADVAVIPLLVAVRTIWHHALGVWTGSNRGFGQIDQFATRGLDFLREWDAVR